MRTGISKQEQTTTQQARNDQATVNNSLEAQQAFEMEGRARVRRNLAAGVYSPEVAELAAG